MQVEATARAREATCCWPTVALILWFAPLLRILSIPAPPSSPPPCAGGGVGRGRAHAGDQWHPRVAWHGEWSASARVVCFALQPSKCCERSYVWEESEHFSLSLAVERWMLDAASPWPLG